MRLFLFLLPLAIAACSKVPEKAAAAAAPAAITFDGAQVTGSGAVLTHGNRLTWVLGCKGCHTPTLTGQNFIGDTPQYGAVYASNLTQVIPHYTDAQIEQILRRGVHPMRKDLWMMPSQVFQRLSAADMKAVLAYLRSLRPAGTRSPPPRFTALGYKLIALGKAKPTSQYVSEFKQKQPVDLGPQYALGRYITSVTCAECHGPELEGHSTGPTKIPDLVVAGGYTRAEFERLITTGVPVGNRKINPIMVEVAQERFPHLTLHERDALYAYLKTRAEKAQ